MGTSSLLLIPNIQYLRAVAALNVVLCHVIGSASGYGRQPEHLVLLEEWSNNGVDIFFVISGFVMGWTNFSKKNDPLVFLKKRIIRIVPLYWILTFAFCSLYLILPQVFNAKTLELSWIFSSLGFLSQLTLQKRPVLFDGWTLEYEMFFYLIFALCLNMGKINQALLAAAAILISLAATQTIDPIVLEFVFGLLCAVIFNKYPDFKYGGLIATLGVVGLVVSLSAHPMAGDRYIYWGLPAALIVASACWVRQIDSRLLRILGDASYSIYLTQVFTTVAAYKFLHSHFVTVNNDLLAIGVVGFTTLAGVSVYYLLEKPTQNFIKERAALRRGATYQL